MLLRVATLAPVARVPLIPAASAALPSRAAHQYSRPLQTRRGAAPASTLLPDRPALRLRASAPSPRFAPLRHLSTDSNPPKLMEIHNNWDNEEASRTQIRKM